MTTTMLTLFSLTVATAFLSIFAASVAAYTLVRFRSWRPSGLLTRLEATSDRLDATEMAIKTLRSRLSMQDLRARRASSSPGEPPEPVELAASDEKAQIRKQLGAKLALKGVSP